MFSCKELYGLPGGEQVDGLPPAAIRAKRGKTKKNRVATELQPICNLVARTFRDPRTQAHTRKHDRPSLPAKREVPNPPLHPGINAVSIIRDSEAPPVGCTVLALPLGRWHFCRVVRTVLVAGMHQVYKLRSCQKGALCLS